MKAVVCAAGKALGLLLGAVLLAATNTGAASDVIPTSEWVELYSGSSEVDGEPIAIGSVVAIFDADGVQCGEFEVTTSGLYGIAYCYGDDNSTEVDEGARVGDHLSFAVDGRAANATAVSLNASSVAPGTAVTFLASRPLWEVDLNVYVEPLEPVLSREALDVVIEWRHTDPAVSAYEVWRSGEPDLMPGSDEATLAATLPIVPNGLLRWVDPNSSTESGNTFYKIRARDAGGSTLAISSAAGRFVFSIVP